MKKIEITVSKKVIAFEKEGKKGEMNAIVLTFPNGQSINVVSNRYNYRTFDYLNDLING